MPFVDGQKMMDVTCRTYKRDCAPNPIAGKVSCDVSAFTPPQKKKQQPATLTGTTTSVRDKVALWEKFGKRSSNSASVAPLDMYQHHQQNDQKGWKQQVQQHPAGRLTTFSKSKSLSSIPMKNYIASAKGTYPGNQLKLLEKSQRTTTISNNNNNSLESENNNTNNSINSKSRFNSTKDLNESLRRIGSDDDDDPNNNNNNDCKGQIPVFRSGSTTSDDEGISSNDESIVVDEDDDDDDDGSMYFSDDNQGGDGYLQLVFTDDNRLTYSHSWSHNSTRSISLQYGNDDKIASFIDRVCRTNGAPNTNTATSTSTPLSNDKKTKKEKDRRHVRSTLSFVMSSIRQANKKLATRRTTKDGSEFKDDQVFVYRRGTREKNNISEQKKNLSNVLPTKPTVVRSKKKFKRSNIKNANNQRTNSCSSKLESRRILSMVQVPPSILERRHGHGHDGGGDDDDEEEKELFDFENSKSFSKTDDGR